MDQLFTDMIEVKLYGIQRITLLNALRNDPYGEMKRRHREKVTGQILLATLIYIDTPLCQRSLRIIHS